MLKKLTYPITEYNSNPNIEALIERFEHVCFFDSNTETNNSAKTTASTLLAVGRVSEVICQNASNSFQSLQQFYDSQNGWMFGYLTYDLKNDIENLSSHNKDRMDFPSLHFFSPKVVIETGLKCFLHYDDDQTSKEEAFEIYELATSRSKPESKNQRIPAINASISKTEYLQSVHHLKEHIRKGDIYEINFCQEFYAENAIIDPCKTYRKLNAISSAPFSAFCKFAKHYLMCASPERFLQKQSNKLISQPIKGTIRRSENEADDETLKKELRHNTKEQSENVMIVDLVRNDLSRIATRGSVNVDELFGIYTFKQVHQMISTVSCELKENISFTEILRNTFPMGSMTGAPKVSAMKLIEKYETTKRGLYSGAVGYISPGGDFDFNVVIRSILYNEKTKTLSFTAGSAITDKSDPEQEYEECLLKAKAMFEVLGSNPKNKG